MPWKGERDPYKIWISEIILQQTRVEQGWAYYTRFIATWPTVGQLAKAAQDDVYKAWEGLGYYSRCRHLIEAAQYINNDLNGRFPARYEDILLLKGVGAYTAAAIASFAFDEPRAVVDGNVFRVLARFFGIPTPVDSTEGRKLFTSLANDLIDPQDPAAYNQAIMDFGAVICRPMAPLCEACPLRRACAAYQKGLVTSLPLKRKMVKVRQRYFNYLIVEQGEFVYMHQRLKKDIWQNLFEFILVETTGQPQEKDILPTSALEALFSGLPFEVTKISENFLQKLTHQTISGRFYHITLENSQKRLKKYRRVSKKEVSRMALPKFINSYLQD